MKCILPGSDSGEANPLAEPPTVGGRLLIDSLDIQDFNQQVAWFLSIREYINNTIGGPLMLL